ARPARSPSSSRPVTATPAKTRAKASRASRVKVRRPSPPTTINAAVGEAELGASLALGVRRLRPHVVTPGEGLFRPPRPRSFAPLAWGLNHLQPVDDVAHAADRVGEILDVALGPAVLDGPAEHDLALVHRHGHVAGIDVGVVLE